MKKPYRVVTIIPGDIDSRLVVGYGDIKECEELKKQMEIASKGKRKAIIERNY